MPTFPSSTTLSSWDHPGLPQPSRRYRRFSHVRDFPCSPLLKLDFPFPSRFSFLFVPLVPPPYRPWSFIYSAKTKPISQRFKMRSYTSPGCSIYWRGERDDAAAKESFISHSIHRSCIKSGGGCKQIPNIYDAWGLGGRDLGPAITNDQRNPTLAQKRL